MNDNDLMQLAEMFDTIVNSDNPAVQRSLQHTMVLAKLAQEQQNMEGPFLKMFKTITDLREDMAVLKRSVQILENNASSLFTSSSQANYANDWQYTHQNVGMNDIMAGLSTIKLSDIHISGAADVASLELFGASGASGARGSDDTIVWIDNNADSKEF